VRSVLIAGAGPAGAATAYLLARRGVPVTLVERERDLERVFRGEALMPSGMDALHQMGLGAAVRALPGRPLACWEVFLDGREILHVEEPAGELGDLALRVVSQPALLRLLIAASRAASPAFRFVDGAGVRDLVREGGGRVRGVRVSTLAGESLLEADLTLGCDGRASTLRRRADLPLALLPESYDVLWFKLPAPEGLADRAPIQIYASGPDVALGYVSWDGRLQLAWMIEKGSWPALRERDWLPALLRLLPEPLAAHVQARAAELEGPALLDVVVGRCPRWWMPGLLLLGDAAHPMSPVRAQGINLALRDAIVAANHLVPACAGDGDLDAAAAAIQAEREREVARVQRLQIREVRGQRWARRRPWLVAPLLRVAPLLTRAPWFPALWLRQQRPLRFGVTEVRLHV
jgi:2-polyprenyl-6-methoxyphenol hydroxylase-like FAD-dependent oxidoreductase